MGRTWSRTSVRSASTSIRANRGSIGSRAIRLPISVRRAPSSPRPGARTAPSSTSRSKAAFTPRESGGVRNGKADTSPKPRESICSTTDARLVRRISGSVNSGRVAKSSSAYRRTAIPGAVRPARPARCWADACDTGSIGRRWILLRALYREMRAVPVSMTYLIPGTVRLVSATFVARMTRRRTPATCERSKTRCCSAAESRPYSGSTSVGEASFAYMPRTASIASRISASPGRNTSTSPAGSRSSSRRARVSPSMSSDSSSDASVRGR